MNLTREAVRVTKELGKKGKEKKKGGDIKRTELVGDCDGTIPVDHGRLEKRKER